MNKKDFPQYNLRCPMCGAKLMLRAMKTGQFIGCSQFGPSGCEYSAPIEEYFPEEATEKEEK